MVTRPDPEDLTARARIRDAALRQFGEHGFAAATIRGIAAAAGVSSGLVRHHFGSKQALRDACDEYLARTLRQLYEQVRADPSYSELNHMMATRNALGPYQPYLVRALVDGSAAGLFDEMARMTEDWLVDLDARRPDPPEVSRAFRATVITAMALGVPVLYQHVSRGVGVDIFSPDGANRLAEVLLDIYSHPLLSTDDAARVRAALDRASTTEADFLRGVPE